MACEESNTDGCRWVPLGTRKATNVRPETVANAAWCVASRLVTDTRITMTVSLYAAKSDRAEAIERFAGTSLDQFDVMSLILDAGDRRGRQYRAPSTNS